MSEGSKSTSGISITTLITCPRPGQSYSMTQSLISPTLFRVMKDEDQAWKDFYLTNRWIYRNKVSWFSWNWRRVSQRRSLRRGMKRLRVDWSLRTWLGSPGVFIICKTWIRLYTIRSSKIILRRFCRSFRYLLWLGRLNFFPDSLKDLRDFLLLNMTRIRSRKFLKIMKNLTHS